MSHDPSLAEALDHCLSRSITFAAFRSPGGPVTLWAQRDPDLDRVESAMLYEVNDAFLIAPFEVEPDRFPIIRSDVELTFGDLWTSTELLHECVGRPAVPGVPPPDTDRSAYESNVAKALDAIMGGTLRKVVLSRCVTVAFDRRLLAEQFMAALENHPEAMVTLAHTPDHGTWLGVSPERLLVAEDDQLVVDALAGTMPAGTAPQDAAAWGEKERHEQALVTVGIVDRLLHLGISALDIRGPEVMTAGQVAHLRTTITADISTVRMEELMLAVHPTAAVCGEPRHEARAFIRAHEAHDRGLYTGFWGPWRADGRTELFVNIRCLKAFDHHATLFAGAGVTHGSAATEEWMETEQKAHVWKERLSTAEKQAAH